MLEPKLQFFLPEYVPSIGDYDAFIKVGSMLCQPVYFSITNPVKDSKT